MARQGAAVPVFEQASGGEDERVFIVRHLHRRHVLEGVELALAAGKSFGEEIGRAGMVVIPHRRLQALVFDAPIFHSGIFRNHTAHLFEHFGWALVCPEGCLRAAEAASRCARQDHR